MSDLFGPEFHLTRPIAGRGALNLSNVTASCLPHWHFQTQLLLFLMLPIFKFLPIFGLAQWEKTRMLSWWGYGLEPRGVTPKENEMKIQQA